VKLTVRYLAMHSTGPADNVEAGIRPVDEAYEFDPASLALVLVDTWNKHPIRSHAESTAAVMRERIAPLLPLVRAAGIPVIYAPSPEVAPSYEQWRRRFGARAKSPGSLRYSWPPPELRRREGEYARYRRRPGETWPDWDGRFPWDAVHDSIAPEPDDHVVATGDELHELLGENRVLFPLYAGFATNICVLHRDYGALAIGARGYLPILLRDCTIGIESADTLDGQLATRMAIHDVERRYYTADSGELLRDLSAG
jgi:nicotinamidase-related amidase